MAWFVLTSAVALAYGPAEMVVDLEDEIIPSIHSYLFGHVVFTEFEGAYYFPWDDGLHGLEMWRTNGTADGTWLVRDICPGECWAFPGGGDIQRVGDHLLFQAVDPVHGAELWRSDGTGKGTELVVDLLPGPRGTSPYWLTPVGNRLFFQARSPTASGNELWVSDGTALGTHRVVSLVEGLDMAAALDDERLFFSDDRTLSVSDGTEAGTRALGAGKVRWNWGTGGSLWRYLHLWEVMDGRIFLKATDASGGHEPWVSDGTDEGTRRLLDVEPGSASSTGGRFLRLGDRVFFHAGNDQSGSELYVTEGTPETTALVVDLDDGPGDSVTHLLGATEATLFFVGRTEATGRELFRTDGTAEGTTLVKDINPGPGHGPLGFVGFGTAAGGGFLLFPADDGIHGPEPWISDGTPGGTLLLQDLILGSQGGYGYLPEIPKWIGDGFLFAPPADGPSWRQPYFSDGTPQGTRLVEEIADQSSGIPECFLTVRCMQPAVVDQRVFFSGWTLDDLRSRLYVTDGTEAGTSVLPIPPACEDCPEPGVNLVRYGSGAVLGSKLLFIVSRESESTETELWMAESGSEGGIDLLPLPSVENPWAPLVAFAGQVYTYGGSSVLWSTDGTDLGTESFALPGGTDLRDALRTEEALYLPGWNGRIWRIRPDSAPELWVDQGVGGLTVPIGALPTGSVTAEESLVFWHDDGASGYEPWIRDAGGIRRIADIAPGPMGSRRTNTPTRAEGLPSLSTSMGSLVFFVADDGTTEPTIWQTDGTEAGTRPTLSGVRAPLYPRGLTRVGNQVFFSAYRPRRGQELWVTNGTPRGTRMLEIAPGPASSIPSHFVAVGDEVFFAAFHPLSGVEVWRSSGRRNGTTLFQDIHPGPGSSSPVSFTPGADRLWFVANDGRHGFELWAAPLDEIFADGFEVGLAPWSGSTP